MHGYGTKEPHEREVQFSLWLLILFGKDKVEIGVRIGGLFLLCAIPLLDEETNESISGECNVTEEEWLSCPI